MLEGKPKVILSEALWYRICRYHQIIGDIEWSGPIWYTTKGKINNPDKMEISVFDFMLKDVGSGAYTEYEFGGEMVDLFDEKPHLLEPGVKMGHMHTHHQMNAFFSGTDMKCLHDNAPLFDMFLSVIVNKAGKRIAKIAVITELQRKFSYTMVRKLFSFRDKSIQCLGIIDCEVVIENEDVIAQEVINVIDEKKKRVKELHKNSRKNYSTPTKHDSVEEYYETITPQLELFDDFEREGMMEEVHRRGDVIDNEELLEDTSIENLIVRSISIDDLATSDLSDAISLIGRKLPSDYTLEIRGMMEHFFDTLQAEYYYDQFRYVVSRAVELLNGYDRYKFIDGIIYSLKCWLDEFNDGDDRKFPDNFVEDGVIRTDDHRSKSNGEIIRYPETQDKNEF